MKESLNVPTTTNFPVSLISVRIDGGRVWQQG